MIETHCNPVCALSDSRQQVTPDELGVILDRIVHRSVSVDSSEFQAYRKQMDEIDEAIMGLMAKRMELSREIGELKREKGLTVFQPSRYDETMKRCEAYCERAKLDPEAMKDVFEAIHSESIRQQLRIVNVDKK